MRRTWVQILWVPLNLLWWLHCGPSRVRSSIVKSVEQTTVRNLKCNQGFTKRCRLSWLTNSALVIEPKCGVEGGWVAGSQTLSTAVHMEPKMSATQRVFEINLRYKTRGKLKISCGTLPIIVKTYWTWTELSFENLLGNTKLLMELGIVIAFELKYGAL